MKIKRPVELMLVLGLLAAYSYARFLAWYYDFSGVLQYLSAVTLGDYWFWLMVAPSLTIWAIFLLLADVKINHEYGNSEWATTRDIKKMNINVLADEGFILGVWKNKFIRIKDTLSTLVVAPPGTGKTVAIAVPTLLSCCWSMIVNDVKNELWELTSLHRRNKLKQKVVRFAPAEKDSAKWNPFSEMPKDSVSEQKIFLNRLSTVIYQAKNEKDEHWPIKARSVFVFFAIVAILNNKKEDSDKELTFADIRSAILTTGDVQGYAAEFLDEFNGDNHEDDEDVEQDYEEYQESFNNDNQQEQNSEPSEEDVFLKNFVTTACNSIIQISTEEFGSVLSTTTKELDVFDDIHIANNTSSSDFKIADLRHPTDKLTVYLSSSMKDMERVKPITRIFSEMAADQLLSDKHPKDNQKVLLLMDEFVKMGLMKKLLSAPDLCRGQKFAVIFIMQSLGQPRELYGKDATDTLISTTAFKVIFTQLHDDTMKQVSNLIGKKTSKKESISKSNSWNSSGTNKSISEEGQPLILPQDIGSLTQEQVIIIVQGYNTRPIMAKSCRWFAVDSMKDLVVENKENQ